MSFSSKLRHRNSSIGVVYVPALLVRLFGVSAYSMAGNVAPTGDNYVQKGSHVPIPFVLDT